MHVHHDQDVRLDKHSRHQARIILACVVIPLLIATIIGAVVTFPYGGAAVDKTPYLDNGVTRARGVVVDKPLRSCQFADELGGSDLLSSAVCVKITHGKGTGVIVPVHVPPENKSVATPGTKLKLFYEPSAVTEGTPYIYDDVQRTVPLAVLVALYVGLVVVVAGRRGAAALVGLATSLLVVVFYLIPALISGQSALVVSVVGAAAMMFLSVYLAHGITIRTTTALLGTFLGVAVTLWLATTSVTWAGLSGGTSDDALYMQSYFPNVSLSALLTCGIVIAGLGALNDVAITQASAVWELFAANPTMKPTTLFSRAMRIGRDHIASTVYTLAFAYVGTALPTFIIAATVDRPVMDLVMSSTIAEEIVRTMVASIGLILAIPATTAMGTFFVTWIHATGEHAHATGAHAAGAHVHGSGGHVADEHVAGGQATAGSVGH